MGPTGDTDLDGTPEAAFDATNVAGGDGVEVVRADRCGVRAEDRLGNSLRRESVATLAADLTLSGLGSPADGDNGVITTAPAYSSSDLSGVSDDATVFDIGSFAQAIVGSVVAGSRFTVRTSEPGVKVSSRASGRTRRPERTRTKTAFAAMPKPPERRRNAPTAHGTRGFRTRSCRPNGASSSHAVTPASAGTTRRGPTAGFRTVDGGLESTTRPGQDTGPATPRQSQRRRWVPVGQRAGR